MDKWIIACNLKNYDIIGAFNTFTKIDWKQSNNSIQVGDEVFIYVGVPYKAVMYRCRVNKTNLKIDEINDTMFYRDSTPYKNYPFKMELELIEKYDEKKYSLEVLKEKGLRGTIQGPRRANDLFDE